MGEPSGALRQHLEGKGREGKGPRVSSLPLTSAARCPALSQGSGGMHRCETRSRRSTGAQ